MARCIVNFLLQWYFKIDCRFTKLCICHQKVHCCWYKITVNWRYVWIIHCLLNNFSDTPWIKNPTIFLNQRSENNWRNLVFTTFLMIDWKTSKEVFFHMMLFLFSSVMINVNVWLPSFDIWIGLPCGKQNNDICWPKTFFLAISRMKMMMYILQI